MGVPMNPAYAAMDEYLEEKALMAEGLAVERFFRWWQDEDDAHKDWYRLGPEYLMAVCMSPYTNHAEVSASGYFFRHYRVT